MSTDNLGNENIDMAVGYSNGYKQGYEQGKKDAVKHGYWVQMGPPNENSETLYRCSICDYLDVMPLYDTHNYCGSCGARMDGDKNETDLCRRFG